MVADKSKTVLTPPKVHISEELLQLAKKTSSATISGTLSKMGFRFVYMAGVLPVRAGTLMTGRAYTLRLLPAREDHWQQGEERAKYAQHIAIESIGSGDVLVVDARGNTKAGIFGDRLIARMKSRGAEGLVTDGAIRDIPYLRTFDFPCFIRAPHGYGHTQEHWAMDVQLPIACGGVTVYPGDLIVGDDDGVVMCPQGIAERVIQESIAQEEEESFTRELLEQGYSVNDVHGKLPSKLQAEYEEWRRKKGI